MRLPYTSIYKLHTTRPAAPCCFTGTPCCCLRMTRTCVTSQLLRTCSLTQGALQALGVPHEEIALLKDCVTASHWALSGCSNTYLATRGSRPGDGLADVLFGALFAIALRHIRQVCRDEGWAHHSAGTLIGRLDEVLPLGWADDLAIMSDFESPSALQQNFPRVAVVALSTLRFSGSALT